MDAYRVPDGQVDKTEIERAKIHEEGETKRKLIEEREATKRRRIDQVQEAPYVAWGVVGAIAIIAGSIVTGMYVSATKEPPPCVDEVWKKDAYSGLKCNRSEQLLVESHDVWTCRCPRHVAPATSEHP